MGMINIACPVCKQVHEWFSGNLDQRCFRCKWSAANTKVEETLPGTIKDESSVWDGQRWHQIVPRRAVLKDICDWRRLSLPSDVIVEKVRRYHSNLRAGGRCEVRIPAQYQLRGPMAFGEWAQNIRTQKMMELNKRMSERLREAEERAANLQDRFNSQYDKICELAKQRDEYAAGYAQQRATVAALTQEIGELQRQLKNYEPVSKYNGLSIEQWQRRALNAESALLTTLVWKDRALKAESELRQEVAIRECYQRSRKRLLAKVEALRVDEDFIKLLRARLREARRQLWNVAHASGLSTASIERDARLDP